MANSVRLLAHARSRRTRGNRGGTARAWSPSPRGSSYVALRGSGGRIQEVYKCEDAGGTNVNAHALSRSDRDLLVLLFEIYRTAAGASRWCGSSDGYYFAFVVCHDTLCVCVPCVCVLSEGASTRA